MTPDIKTINEKSRNRKRKPTTPPVPEEQSPIAKESNRGSNTIVSPYPTIDEINHAARTRAVVAKNRKPMRPSAVSAVKQLSESVAKLAAKVSKDHAPKPAAKKQVKRLSRIVQLTVPKK